MLADNPNSLLEIFVGIICACIPSAAKSCNHHLQSLRALKTLVVSQLSKVSLSTKQSQSSLLSRRGDHQPGQYANVDVYQGPEYPGKARTQPTKTFIRSGEHHDVENDGIHLTFEMQSQLEKAVRSDREMGRWMESVEMDDDSVSTKQNHSLSN